MMKLPQKNIMIYLSKAFDKSRHTATRYTDLLTELYSSSRNSRSASSVLIPFQKPNCVLDKILLFSMYELRLIHFRFSKIFDIAFDVEISL